MESTSDAEQAFEELFQTHHQAIFRYCIRRLGRTDAEDAAAEVFAVAWRRREGIPRGESGRAWLFGVAFRVVGNRYRSVRRQTRLTIRIQGALQRVVPPVETTEPGLLLHALGRLSDTDREILQLSTWDDLDRREIAQVLGINDNAVDQGRHGARRRHRDEYDKVSGNATGTLPKEASA